MYPLNQLKCLAKIWWRYVQFPPLQTLRIFVMDFSVILYVECTAVYSLQYGQYIIHRTIISIQTDWLQFNHEDSLDTLYCFFLISYQCAFTYLWLAGQTALKHLVARIGLYNNYIIFLAPCVYHLFQILQSTFVDKVLCMIVRFVWELLRTNQKVLYSSTGKQWARYKLHCYNW